MGSFLNKCSKCRVTNKLRWCIYRMTVSKSAMPDHCQFCGLYSCIMLYHVAQPYNPYHWHGIFCRLSLLLLEWQCHSLSDSVQVGRSLGEAGSRWIIWQSRPKGTQTVTSNSWMLDIFFEYSLTNIWINEKVINRFWPIPFWYICFPLMVTTFHEIHLDLLISVVHKKWWDCWAWDTVN